MAVDGAWPLVEQAVRTAFWLVRGTDQAPRRRAVECTLGTAKQDSAAATMLVDLVDYAVAALTADVGATSPAGDITILRADAASDRSP